MKDHRQGNDLAVLWSILKDGEPFDLRGRSLKLYLKNLHECKEVEDFSVTGNKIHWTFYGKDQDTLGKHSLILVVNEDKKGMITTDACDFVRLVSCSCKLQGGEDAPNVETESIELTTTLEYVAGEGGGSYDDSAIWEAVTKLNEDKVDKVEGKQLSSNDYTDEDKEKLAELSSEVGKKVAKGSLATINNQSIENGGNITIEGGGNSVIATGTFAEAQEKASGNDGIWMWLLNDVEIKKPIWHIGNGVFIDAAGAEVFIENIEPEPELNVFQYTIVLDEDNATTYVPILLNRPYNMVVDWGDGSEQQSYVQGGAYKGLSHSYTGKAGTKYQITLKGTGVNALAFEDARTFNQSQLYSIDNNTLQYPTIFGFDKGNSFTGCVNLVSVSANALLNSVENASLSFRGCSSLKTLPVGILDNKELTSLSYFVGGCSVLELSEDFMNALAQKISGVTSLFYAFQGCKGKIHIPDNFFDNIVGNITDVRQMTLNATGVTGDAKKLYDSLNTKVTTENVLGCFSGANLSNRDQVPTTWGGTMK